MVAFPPVQSTSSSACARAVQLTRRQRLRRLRLTDPWLRDRHHQRRTTSGGALNPASGLYLHTVDGPNTSCIEAGGNTSYSEALRQAQQELAHERPAQRPELHRLPDRWRGQHRQRLRHRLSARQCRRPAALPDGSRPGHQLQGRRHDDLQHRLCARRQCQLHRRSLPQEEQPGQLGLVHGRHRRLLPLRRPDGREPGDHLLQHPLADRLARRLLQPAERRASSTRSSRRSRPTSVRARAASSTTASKRLLSAARR